MKKIALAALITCAAYYNAKAQIVARDIFGMPMREKTYTDVKGSPYLEREWAVGEVTLANGSKYSGIELLYDQVSDELIFKGPNGDKQVFSHPVQEFIIQSGSGGNRKFRKGYAPTQEGTSESFYEVLADGKVQFLKKTVKTISETRPYGSASTVKSFQENDFYYLAKENKPVRIKRDKKSVLAVLNDKAAALEKYIKEASLNVRATADLAKLVTYYNSLN